MPFAGGYLDQPEWVVKRIRTVIRVDAEVEAIEMEKLKKSGDQRT
jgi:hypothetical protein